MNLHTIHKGFTLVETLVAISVLLLVVIGPMTVAQKGIQNAYFANDQMAAVFLAQEAIEGVREERDRRALAVYDNPNGNTAGWISSVCAFSGTSCEVGYDVSSDGTTSFAPCSQTNNNCVLLYDAETGRYSHTDGDTSPFTRIVTVGEEIDGGIPVMVEVRWTAQVFDSTERVVRLQTWVYDHYQRFEN